MELAKAEEIGRIYSETSCNYGSFGEIVKLLYGEVIRQREYIETLEKVITMSEGFISDIERILQSKGVQND